MFKFLSLTILTAVFALFALGSEEPDPKAVQVSMAQVMCQDFVKKRLKSPSTAEFASAFDGYTAKHLRSDKTYHYYSMRTWVDSQNGFGAMLRTNFFCKIKNKIGTDEWRLESLDMK